MEKSIKGRFNANLADFKKMQSKSEEFLNIMRENEQIVLSAKKDGLSHDVVKNEMLTVEETGIYLQLLNLDLVVLVSNILEDKLLADLEGIDLELSEEDANIISQLDKELTVNFSVVEGVVQVVDATTLDLITQRNQHRFTDEYMKDVYDNLIQVPEK